MPAPSLRSVLFVFEAAACGLYAAWLLSAVAVK